MEPRRFLFVHQNFPGQFRHLAAALAQDPGNTVLGVGEARNLQGRPPLHPRLQLAGYAAPAAGGAATHGYLREHEGHVRRAQAVARLLLQLRESSRFDPEVVLAHPGWGEALFLRDVFPRARHLQYAEFYYRGTGADVGFDPEFPSSLDDQLRVRMKNSTQLQSLVAADAAVSPTAWQKSRYPAELQGKIDVIHDGVVTERVHPDPAASLQIQGQRFAAGDEVVTYVARNLEPYRGFHVFMRMLPRLQALRPRARVLVVGGDAVSYGRRLPQGQGYRQLLQSQLGDRVDWSRVVFAGQLSYGDYLKVLQVSAVHAYLSYPFVLSWSMLEAMAAGCLVVGSRTAPVEEVLEHGRNGLLVDFFDGEGWARTLADVLARPQQFRALRAQARQDAVDRFDLHGSCLPRMLHWLRG